MRTARLYDERDDDSTRVLVDRLWPRGIRRNDPRIDRWLPQAAPSTELRKWYGHDRERFAEFSARYRAELDTSEGRSALAELSALAADRPITLVTSTREVSLSHLSVLAGILDEQARP
ncbi:DUF488 domain-containing protein [Propionicimonas sp.]|uniref:DUF488 domain-containing protein n=1 Tax=Propionicimonas sp. TaxID=1955623 RepID=UPI0039E71938